MPKWLQETIAFLLHWGVIIGGAGLLITLFLKGCSANPEPTQTTGYIPHKVINQEINFYTDKIQSYCAVNEATHQVVDEGICNEMKYQLTQSLEEPLKLKEPERTGNPNQIEEDSTTAQGYDMALQGEPHKKKQTTLDNVIQLASEAVDAAKNQVDRNNKVMGGN